jgi:hypothetical protein
MIIVGFPFPDPKREDRIFFGDVVTISSNQRKKKGTGTGSKYSF